MPNNESFEIKKKVTQVLFIYKIWLCSRIQYNVTKNYKIFYFLEY